MPPTADNSIVGHRSSVRISAATHGLNQKTMRTETMMTGDMNPCHGFPSSAENAAATEKKNSRYDFFFKEPCIYTHKIYSNAAKVFNVLKHETKAELENPYYRRKTGDAAPTKVVLPELDFEDDNEKRLSFELAYETLKYQRVFEDLLDECSFFIHFPECSEDQSLVMVVLWDYQNRKFQQRTPFKDEIIDPIVQSVEDAIIEYKTKLNASLARHRIKASAPSLEFLLPEKVRSTETIGSNLPVCVWVNMLKTSLDSVVSSFKDERFSLVDVVDHQDGKVFHVDPHCNDMLVFPPEHREYIQEHDLIKSGYIVMQDKSSCIAPHTIKYLIGDDDDVIHVNAGSLVTTAHISSLMNTSTGHILAFNATRGPDTSKTLEKLGAKNIKLQTESFLEIDLEDNKFKNVKVVLVTADCSKSGISNPIDFIVNEGEDMKILKYLSKGETDDSKLGEMIANHGNLLKQTMKLSKVQAVVYMTRSIHDAENESVVTRSVEHTNMIQQRKYPFRVVPPVLPFTGQEIEKGIGISGKYIKFKPTDRSCGSFVAVITREPEELTHKDILARAKAKGLLGEKKKSKKEKIPELEQNGVASGEEPEEEKLLEKRVKRAPRKLRSSGSVPAYTRPSATSIVRAQINSTSKIGHRATKSTGAVSNKPSPTRTKTLAEPPARKEKKPVLSEHVKVVKHPAPFSPPSMTYVVLANSTDPDERAPVGAPSSGRKKKTKSKKGANTGTAPTSVESLDLIANQDPKCLTLKVFLDRNSAKPST